MKKFHFLGQQTQLGRFGTVTRGDVLDLTDKEALDITDDKRFRPFDPKKTFEPTKLPLPEGFDDLSADEQAKVVRDLEGKEETRRVELEKANLATSSVELDDMSRAELLDIAAGLRLRGTKVDFRPDASRRAIKAAIQMALRITPRDDDAGGDDEGEETGADAGGKTETIPPAPEVPPAVGKARELTPGLDDFTQAELDVEIAAMEAEGRKVTPAGGKRQDKIDAIKAASAVLL